MDRKLRTACVLGLLVAIPAVARAQDGSGPPAEPTRPPLERGLIVGSVEQAVEQPLERYDDFSLVVDLSERKLYVMSGDEVRRTWPVSVGLASYPTPTGRFQIQRMLWNPSWTPPPSAWAADDEPQPPGAPGNPLGRVKIFFRAPDYYIHGTGLAGSLGNARSHGCIRMRNADVVELARMIMFHAGAEKSQEWYRETVAQKETTREVSLPRAVTVRIRE